MAGDSVCCCDGCGQSASAEHVARRLRRLEWTTRYRPIHIGMLLLGDAAPRSDSEFLYAPEGEFQGESGSVLEAAGINSGKSAEETLSEFQRRGFLLAHVLECPVEAAGGQEETTNLLEERLEFVAARIRRSLKPKRIALISGALDPFIPRLQSATLGCPLVLDGGKAFSVEADPSVAVVRLRDVLAMGVTAR